MLIHVKFQQVVNKNLESWIPFNIFWTDVLPAWGQWGISLYFKYAPYKIIDSMFLFPMKRILNMGHSWQTQTHSIAFYENSIFLIQITF